MLINNCLLVVSQEVLTGKPPLKLVELLPFSSRRVWRSALQAEGQALVLRCIPRSCKRLNLSGRISVWPAARGCGCADHTSSVCLKLAGCGCSGEPDFTSRQHLLPLLPAEDWPGLGVYFCYCFSPVIGRAPSVGVHSRGRRTCCRNRLHCWYRCKR